MKVHIINQVKGQASEQKEQKIKTSFVERMF